MGVVLRHHFESILLLLEGELCRKRASRRYRARCGCGCGRRGRFTGNNGRLGALYQKCAAHKDQQLAEIPFKKLFLSTECPHDIRNIRKCLYS